MKIDKENCLQASLTQLSLSIFPPSELLPFVFYHCGPFMRPRGHYERLSFQSIFILSGYLYFSNLGFAGDPFDAETSS
ncbi:hypothetical protein GPL15_16740 [Clostridium sp. MCC353]|uniref:hypothetical protein n=1 Tax=Clostridium sp. MCC353 TaxID=2592646 RepID=UPI001C038079|nr:hypothetical protein [Clostridium sp. MCC353]MBT9778149.1 hypothetical protein [Clostridium sp. MCC353]